MLQSDKNEPMVLLFIVTYEGKFLMLSRGHPELHMQNHAFALFIFKKRPSVRKIKHIGGWKKIKIFSESWLVVT